MRQRSATPKVRRLVRCALLLGSAVVYHSAVAAQSAPGTAQPSAPDALRDGFETPPASARPRAWWHWMNGNISHDGIDKDLAWMKRIGVGGVAIFDANMATPQVVEHRHIYMHSDWQDAFRHAVDRAEALQMDVAIPGSPGWSETGGPWVPPEDGLKKLVWSETVVPGGRRFKGRLPSPPGVTGPFQTLPLNDPLAAISGDQAKPAPQLSGPVAVLAYQIDAAPFAVIPRLTVSGGRSMDAAPLMNDDLEDGPTLAKGTANDPATLTYVYATPQTVRSATLFAPGQKSLFTGAALAPMLQASDDGTNWRNIVEIPAAEVPTTVSFPPITATYFRIRLVPQKAAAPNLGSPAPGADLSQANVAWGTDEKPLRVTVFKLYAESRVSQYERKAAFAYVPDYYALDSRDPATPGANPKKVIDLTKHLRPDGFLDWTPPSGGQWRIVRLGWSLLGTTNHPAPAEATGLEVDKFDGAAVRRYLEHYLDTYRKTVGDGKIGKAGITTLQTDSIEVGATNWTPRMLDQFRRLRGYDPTPWLPALTGGLIGTREQSDRFLYDYRRTLADLMASEHYATVAKVGHEQGLTVYSEALENGRPQIGDDMAMRSHADVPMGAMWTYARNEEANPSFVADIKGAASVANIYGRKLVAAESMTSALNPWAYAPSDLRRVMDLAFVNGLNRPYIHSVVHQPVDDRQPGLSLSVFGQFFNRHETWAEMARPWMDYLARNSYMLQQGRNVADVAYFYGEEAPITGLFGNRLVSDAPTRYAYDFIGQDALMNQVRVAGGDLAANGGARYRLLYLGGSSRKMTLGILQQLEKLVRAGMTLVGPAPESSPSLADEPTEWRRAVKTLWPSDGAEARLGTGRVVAGGNVESALAMIGATPDFEVSNPPTGSQILFAHRRIDHGDLYFLTNRRNRPERVTASFRVTGKVPEIWHADTGVTESVSYRIEGGKTKVNLAFTSEDSFYVIFRRPATAATALVSVPEPRTAAMIDGPWTVSFQPGRGAPAEPSLLPKLAPLSESKDAGVRYFSGVATYSTTFSLPRGHKPGGPLLLDLGNVGDVAEVLVNGRSAGVVWHAPWRVDIGKVAGAGQNQLEVRVANLWVNRLIGDQQPDTRKVTFTAIPTYRTDAPLRASGLIGPVRLLAPR